MAAFLRLAGEIQPRALPESPVLSFALREWMAGWDYWSILPVYFLLALVSSLACLWIVDSLKKRVPWGRLIHAKAQ